MNTLLYQNVRLICQVCMNLHKVLNITFTNNKEAVYHLSIYLSHLLWAKSVCVCIPFCQPPYLKIRLMWLEESWNNVFRDLDAVKVLSVLWQKLLEIWHLFHMCSPVNVTLCCPYSRLLPSLSMLSMSHFPVCQYGPRLPSHTGTPLSLIVLCVTIPCLTSVCQFLASLCDLLRDPTRITEIQTGISSVK